MQATLLPSRDRSLPEVEAPSSWSRIFPAITLISQLLVEVTTSSLLLILAQHLEQKASTSQPRTRFQLTPEYLENKAKVRKLEGHFIAVRRRIDGIESFVKEYEAAKSKIEKEALAEFHKYLRMMT